MSELDENLDAINKASRQAVDSSRFKDYLLGSLAAHVPAEVFAEAIENAVEVDRRHSTLPEATYAPPF